VIRIDGVGKRDQTFNILGKGEDMIDECRRSAGGRDYPVSDCWIQARIYYDLVRVFGGGAFRKAQRNPWITLPAVKGELLQSE
jgi:hypothetical protein